MKIVQINKENWADGLKKLSETYRLFGPVKEDDFHNFKLLEAGQLPDLSCLNTRLSPKSIIYPQTEVMFEYSLDENQEDHHILKEVDKDYSPQAVIGIRPCDARAFALVKLNFDTPEYQDPYWLKAYETTTLVGQACESPCTSCFCTTAGCGPYHEEQLDLLLIDNGDQYWVKVITEKGENFVAAAGWAATVDAQTALKEIEVKKNAAEDKISAFVKTDNLREIETNDLYNATFWEEISFSCIRNFIAATARCVLPVPGGPQYIIERIFLPLSILRITPSSPSR